MSNPLGINQYTRGQARAAKSTRGAIVSYSHAGGTKGFGGHAFSVKVGRGATHTIFAKPKVYSQAKKEVMASAKRVSARKGSHVVVKHLG